MLAVFIAIVLGASLGHSAPLPASHPSHPRRINRTSFYHEPKDNAFLDMGKSIGTDKVSRHAYESTYAKYFESDHMRFKVRKILEIGLGCDMEYGAGRSAALWKRYFPNAEIWMAEYDAACVQRHSNQLKELGINALVGDQSDVNTLHSWISTSGGDFDVVIDDGGHTSMQMFNSFMVLFQHALKPGGIYILEDLHVVRTGLYVDGDRRHIMIDVIKDWLEALVLDPGDGDIGGTFKVFGYTLFEPKQKFGLPPGLKMIDCSRACCVFTKCLVNDKRCDSPRYDASLPAAYASRGRRNSQ